MTSRDRPPSSGTDVCLDYLVFLLAQHLCPHPVILRCLSRVPADTALEAKGELLQPRLMVIVSFERVGIGIIGLFLHAASWHSYISAVINYATHYPEATPPP